MVNLLLKIKKLLILCTNKFWFFGLINGVAANIELRKILKHIQPFSIIDIGSNKGQFILLSKGLFQNLIFYSFEPQRNEIKIQKKIFKNFKNIRYFNFALGEKEMTKSFFITRRKDSSSFLKISSDLEGNFNYQVKKEKKVFIKQINKVLNFKKIKKPILVKIDVQGYERKVLDGFGNSIKYVDYFIIEVSNLEMYKKQPQSKEIINFLINQNFKIIKKNKWNKIQQNKNIKQTDILFQYNGK